MQQLAPLSYSFSEKFSIPLSDRAIWKDAYLGFARNILGWCSVESQFELTGILPEGRRIIIIFGPPRQKIQTVPTKL